MKTLIYFFATAFISYGIAMAGIYAKGNTEMLTDTLVAFGIWGLFLWHVNGVMKKKQKQRQFRAYLDRQQFKR
jgi:hypothetical protein